MSDSFKEIKNKTRRHQLENAQIKCQNEGCSIMIPLKLSFNQFGKDPYIKHFENCGFTPSMCRYCKRTDILKKDLVAHEESCDH